MTTRSFVVVQCLKVQSQILLPPDFDVIEKVIEGCEEMKTGQMPEISTLIYLLHAGRLCFIGPMMEDEMRVRNVGMYQWRNVSNAELIRQP
jgi:hypothetical protein